MPTNGDSNLEIPDDTLLLTSPATPYEYGTPKSNMQTSDEVSVPILVVKPDNVLHNHGFTIFLALCACQGSFLFGYNVGFSSPTSTDVKNDAGLSQHETDLMWSMLNVGGMIGSLVAGRLAADIGRRMTIICNAIPYCIGVLLMSFWVDYTGTMFGRILCGVGVGWSSVIVPLYIAEISPVSLRGTLGACNQLFVTIGILAVNSIGLQTVSHHHFWKFMMILSLFFVALMVVPIALRGPETPVYLVENGRFDEARNALIRLRGDFLDIDGELDRLHQNTRKTRSSSTQSGTSWRALLEEKNYRPFRIGIAVVMLQQWSGINAFIFNSKSLFQGGGDDDSKTSESSDRKALYGAVIVAAVQVVFTGVSAALMDIKGRRFFLILSSGVMALSCLVMGIVYRADASTEVKIAVVICYIMAFAMGLGPVPWLYCSEIFPPEARGLMVSLCTVVNWLSAFAITFSYDGMKNSLGQDVTFWCYGCVCLVGMLFVVFFVPETKGKSLEEVEKLFASAHDMDATSIDSRLLDSAT